MDDYMYFGYLCYFRNKSGTNPVVSWTGARPGGGVEANGLSDNRITKHYTSTQAATGVELARGCWDVVPDIYTHCMNLLYLSQTRSSADRALYSAPSHPEQGKMYPEIGRFWILVKMKRSSHFCEF